MTDDELNAARHMVESTTGGPWESRQERRDGQPVGTLRWIKSGDDTDHGSTVAQWVLPQDAAFIAASRTLVPRLLAEVDRLRARVQELDAELSQLRDLADIVSDADIAALPPDWWP